ncbi:hypothetical protein BCD49_02980 [Pseudofrankia sp. EUN1h]|nr:hypothetical protein BCD49_02980 [Pseudofrankia sp. EUN1h]
MLMGRLLHRPPGSAAWFARLRVPDCPAGRSPTPVRALPDATVLRPQTGAVHSDARYRLATAS